MSSSVVLDPRALGPGPYPSFGDLLSEEQRRQVFQRAELLGGDQFAHDVLAWLDDHDPQYRATVRLRPIDAAGNARTLYVNAADPIDAAYSAVRQAGDMTAAGTRHLVEVFSGWARDVDPEQRLMRCMASWDTGKDRVTFFDEEETEP